MEVSWCSPNDTEIQFKTKQNKTNKQTNKKKTGRTREKKESGDGCRRKKKKQIKTFHLFSVLLSLKQTKKKENERSEGMMMAKTRKEGKRGVFSGVYRVVTLSSVYEKDKTTFFSSLFFFLLRIERGFPVPLSLFCCGAQRRS